MTDRELLELAAKAAGLDDARYCTFAGMEERCGFGGAIYSDKHAAGMGSGYWNPLEDDGDALRLAVKMGFKIVYWRNDQSVAMYKSQESSSPLCYERCGGDPYAATRRAIVRAAAEIRKASSNA